MKWQKHGLIIEPELPFEGTMVQSFTSCIEPLDNDEWRIWYSTSCSPGYDGFNIAVAEGPLDGLKRYPAVLSSGEPADERFAIGHLPDGWYPRQHVHITMPDGSHRLYFWVHGEGIVRFLCAESDDGRRFRVINADSPCLYHLCDRDVAAHFQGAEGLAGAGSGFAAKEVAEDKLDLVVNDATNLYLLPDGTFELYTANVVKVPDDDPRYIAHDNAPGLFRVIERRTSTDGLNWSRGEIALQPDRDDPPELQFYYLAVTYDHGKRIGQIGYYDVKKQTMDIEWCVSDDGINWQRPFRQPGFPREEERNGSYGVYAPGNLVYRYNKWHLFYTNCNYTHNLKQCSGKQPVSDIRLATSESIPFYK